MVRKLKVFRTTAGFSDAYVAAPSRKAALAAWGADVDLFARGIAEQVTDPALTAAPLARPGEVLTVSRGDLAAHLEALKTQDRPARKGRSSAAVEMKRAKKPALRKRKRPPPSRNRLDAAEEALDSASAGYREQEVRLERERDEAERALNRLRGKRDRELATLARRRDAARDAYRDALERWNE